MIVDKAQDLGGSSVQDSGGERCVELFFMDRLSFLGGRSAGGCLEEEEREGGSVMGCCAASAVGFSLADPRFFRWAFAGG